MKERIGKCVSYLGIILIVLALSLSFYNVYDSIRANISSKSIMNDYMAHVSSGPQGFVPDYILNPDMDMPEVEVDGLSCIGVLEIPSLDIQLPITSTFSYTLMKQAPCRYYGSIYKNNMVIAAHDSWFHFGRIHTLKSGDSVKFTDASSNQFDYCVDAVDVVSPNSVDDVTSDKWPLTLFTCTLDAQNRVVVRCK